jgi:hypothetical protein
MSSAVFRNLIEPVTSRLWSQAQTGTGCPSGCVEKATALPALRLDVITVASVVMPSSSLGPYSVALPFLPYRPYRLLLLPRWLDPPSQPEGRGWRHQSVSSFQENLACASRAKMAEQGKRPRDCWVPIQRRSNAPKSVPSKPGTALLFEPAPIFTSFLWFSFQVTVLNWG